MHIIAGLGNPSREHENTRHNIGFDVINLIARQENINVLECRYKALIGKGYLEGQKVILAKPHTFMNLSGESIRELIRYYKVDELLQLIVIADDVSLDIGRLRIRKKGSAGGHNGLKNIIDCLGHSQFIRVKMGVGGKPTGYDLADYVLGHFGKEERVIMDKTAKAAADAVRCIIREGVDVAMNRFNT
jgi:PTH1 family peptidyl-tRNA hydrolase